MVFRPEGGSSNPPAQNPFTAKPIRLSDDLKKAILALPALQPVYTDAAKTQVQTRPTGKLELASQSARTDGARVLQIWAETQSPGMGGKLQTDSVLMEVWLDPAGKPTLARQIGARDPELADMERLIDKL